MTKVRSANLMTIASLAVALANCSGGGKVEGEHRTPSGFEESPLKKVGFTGSVVRPERRFAGYVPTAGRLSLIDPTTEDEAWGAPLAVPPLSVTGVVALPGYDGAALFTGRGLRVIAADADRTFPDAGFDVGHLAVAGSAAAYAMVSLDGKQLRVVRFLAGLDWQDETFTLPWSAEDAPTAPAADEAPLAVALFAEQGTSLIVLRPADGRYVVFSAADKAEALTGPVADCAGDGVGTHEAPTFRSAARDESTLYLGDRVGRMVAVEPAAGASECQDHASLPSVTLGSGLPVTNISVLATGAVGVTLGGGGVYEVAYTDPAFGVPVSYSTHCTYPLGLARLDASRLLLGCYYRAEPVVGASEYPATVEYERASLIVVDRASTANDGVEIEVPHTGLGGGAGALALDLEGLRLIELKDSALGILRFTSLVDGGVSLRKGLFLKDVLK